MSKEYLYKTATELAIIKQEMLRQQHELELHRQKMRDFSSAKSKKNKMCKV